MTPIIVQGERSAILYDSDAADHAEDAWFEPEHWARAGRLARGGAGRGATWMVSAPQGDWVLRHYRRGGLPGRLIADRYLWTGLSQTRAWREFRLLVQIHALGLPAPAPVAARVIRHGWSYTADLLTRRIPAARSLAESLPLRATDAGLWAAVGRTIARFHAAGIYHADLNAHNILLQPDGTVWLLDFDRGDCREPAAGWQNANLARLWRSVNKLSAGTESEGDLAAIAWPALLSAYDAV